VDSSLIAYLAFTRAAAKEAVVRIMEGEEDVSEDTVKERFPLFRTIHSLAYRGLKGAKPDLRVMTPADMKAFSKETGYQGRFAVSDWEDMSDALQRARESSSDSVWDKALAAYMISRVTAATAEGFERARTEMSPAALRMGFIQGHVYRALIKRYEDFKKREGLVDFTDMLEFAATEMKPLDHVRRVVIDESQDLCAAHYQIGRLFPNADEVWYAGDEDQAIFSFSGASADLFLDRYRRASRRIILRQTYRFGREIVDYSAKIIRRIRNRIEKNIIGVAGRQGRIEKAGKFVPPKGEVLILHRHVQGCQEIARAFVEAGLPFRNERGKDPLSAHERIKAWMALEQLAKGATASAGGIRILLEDYMPSFRVDEHGQKVRLIARGGIKKIGEIAGSGIVMNLADLVGGAILTESGVEVISSRGYQVFDHWQDFEYYGKVVENGHDLDGVKVPVITTMHGSKGRQAERVIVFSEMNRRCWDDRDTEHRLAYVAATRTKTDLTVCSEGHVDWASSDYDYP
jgi:superfamily I DNA/RNA helicase